MIKRQQNGFTIVELLIVIVVIGILAAISTVAFNGIQTRAENTKTLTALRTYGQALATFKSDNGRYPITPVVSCFGDRSTNNPCGSTPTGTVTDATCYNLASYTTQSNFTTDMKSILGENLPQTSSQKMKCSNGEATGALYYSPDGAAVIVYYFLRGNQPCNANGFTQASRAVVNDTTFCNVTPAAS